MKEKPERLYLRVSPKEKHKIENLAKSRGLSFANCLTVTYPTQLKRRHYNYLMKSMRRWLSHRSRPQNRFDLIKNSSKNMICSPICKRWKRLPPALLCLYVPSPAFHNFCGVIGRLSSEVTVLIFIRGMFSVITDSNKSGSFDSGEGIGNRETINNNVNILWINLVVYEKTACFICQLAV